VLLTSKSDHHRNKEQYFTDAYKSDNRGTQTRPLNPIFSESKEPAAEQIPCNII